MNSILSYVFLLSSCERAVWSAIERERERGVLVIISPEHFLFYYIQPGRTAVSHQNYQYYDQEYDFPESDPLFVPPRAMELISEADQNIDSGEDVVGVAF